MTTTCHNISISLYVMTTLLFYSEFSPKRFLTIRQNNLLSGLLITGMDNAVLIMNGMCLSYSSYFRFFSITWMRANLSCFQDLTSCDHRIPLLQHMKEMNPIVFLMYLEVFEIFDEQHRSRIPWKTRFVQILKWILFFKNIFQKFFNMFLMN